MYSAMILESKLSVSSNFPSLVKYSTIYFRAQSLVCSLQMFYFKDGFQTKTSFKNSTCSCKYRRQQEVSTGLEVLKGSRIVSRSSLVKYLTIAVD